MKVLNPAETPGVGQTPTRSPKTPGGCCLAQALEGESVNELVQCPRCEGFGGGRAYGHWRTCLLCHGAKKVSLMEARIWAAKQQIPAGNYRALRGLILLEAKEPERLVKLADSIFAGRLNGVVKALEDYGLRY